MFCCCTFTIKRAGEEGKSLSKKMAKLFFHVQLSGSEGPVKIDPAVVLFRQTDNIFKNRFLVQIPFIHSYVFSERLLI